MGLSRLYSGCRKCPFKGTCQNKRMEALAVMEPMLQDAAAPLTSPMAAPIMKKHDYRNVKVAEGTTITIDLEELKEQMVRDHFPELFREATF